jgi:RHS repeat-associated protein
VRFVVHQGTGAIAQAIEYDEYGRVLADSAPGFQPFGFAGGIYEPETGLVRFGARDYVAFVGAWSSMDV